MSLNFWKAAHQEQERQAYIEEGEYLLARMEIGWDNETRTYGWYDTADETFYWVGADSTANVPTKQWMRERYYAQVVNVVSE